MTTPQQTTLPYRPAQKAPIAKMHESKDTPTTSRETTPCSQIQRAPVAKMDNFEESSLPAGNRLIEICDAGELGAVSDAALVLLDIKTNGKWGMMKRKEREGEETDEEGSW